MDELKSEQNALEAKLSKKEDQDWKALKAETKELLSKKEKELQDVYQKMTTKKESELKQELTIKNEKFMKEIE